MNNFRSFLCENIEFAEITYDAFQQLYKIVIPSDSDTIEISISSNVHLSDEHLFNIEMKKHKNCKVYYFTNPNLGRYYDNSDWIEYDHTKEFIEFLINNKIEFKIKIV